MKKEAKSEYVKVSYNITKETKAVLDKLKDKGQKNISDLINTICKFDFESAEKYIEIINLIHNTEDEFRRMRVSNGAIYLRNDTKRIDFLASAFESDFDAVNVKGAVLKDDKKIKQDVEEHKFVTKTELENHTLLVIHLNEKYELINKNMEKLEKVLKENGIEIKEGEE